MKPHILTIPPPPVRARSPRPLEPWQAELRDAVRDPQQLCELLHLPAEMATQADAGHAQFPLLVPPSYLRRIARGNPGDPLLRQVWPDVGEATPVLGFTHDPVAEADAQIVPGLLQKYAGRALLIAAPQCAIHCRYCFRRHYPYEDAAPSDAAWDAALTAVNEDETLREIILSGGDPLSVPDRRLARLVERLSAVPHLLRLRIHTRLPVVIPSRVTDALVELLSATRLTPVMVIHANHAQELDVEVLEALARLRTAGVMLLNQAVLLAGVNDDVDALAALSERLLELGVLPYYLHQLDRVAGAAHFEVPVERGVQLVEELRRRLPGYAVPQYVQETPGEPHKTPLA